MKKIFAALCAFALVLALCFTSFAVTLDYRGQEIKIGSLHNLNADVKYSWLNKLVLRDSATAVTTARLVPHASYPYSRTYEEFMADVVDVMELSSYDTGTVSSTYENVLDLLYYTAVALGMTADMDTMLSTIAKSGIRIPVNMTSSDKIMAAVVYAALKYDLTNVLFKHKVNFTKGRSIDGAAVDILSACMNMTLPSGVGSLEDLALYACKVYAESYDELPMSEDPSKEEIFYLMEMLASNKAGYDVPIVEYSEATDIQKQYIDCTYYASVLDTVYSTHIDPLNLAKAYAENDVSAVARLVLTTMLDESRVEYNDDDALENLFTLACKNGKFNMDEEFYSDVFNYDLYVDESCEKLWVTPFSLANQLGGDEKFESIKIGSKEISPSVTTFFPLDPKEPKENMTVTVTYDDGENGDMSIYVFSIIKQKPVETTADNDIVAEIEKMLGDVVPEGSEKAQSIVGEVIGAADSIVEKGESVAAQAAQQVSDAITGENADAARENAVTTYAIESEAFESTTLSGFEYFSQLMNETYAAKAELTGEYNTAAAATKVEGGALSGVAQVVKENPEVVVAPTGVAAVGVLAGYLFTKRKNNPADDVNEGEDETE